jgi:hypothetical protein
MKIEIKISSNDREELDDFNALLADHAVKEINENNEMVFNFNLFITNTVIDQREAYEQVLAQKQLENFVNKISHDKELEKKIVIEYLTHAMAKLEFMEVLETIEDCCVFY